ncbi:hypothetical protein [Pseudomonas sp.]|uniref:hypothetical protein n=1 Tax=Pseudomonas sp. TaxID=306 RepID=UPI0028AB2BC2|nr:hypothetical protein [Pseudomonas sp.]
MKVKVTNSGPCPRGVWALGFIKVVGVGASRELTLSEDDVEQIQKIDALSVEVIEGPATDEKADLFAKLKALGIEAGKNSSVKTLQDRLAEAEAKAKADAIAKLKEKGVEVGDDVALEELQAELAKHQ